jgi:aminoglycoside phosphotransferase (APT) family kinase protein
VSNKTVLVERPSGEAWVLKQALPKLRVKVDWFSDPSRIRREALALRWLPRLAPARAFTPLVFEDPGRYLLAMAAVPQPHENWKTTMLAHGFVRPWDAREFGRLLGTIHGGAHARREEVAPPFEDRGFFESLRLEPYYEYAASRVPAAADFLRALVAETRATRRSLVHGDYSPKNVLLPRGGPMVLLDHEVIHWGDPAFDVGFALTHLLSKGHHLPKGRGTFAAGACEFWNSYEAALGDVPWGGAELEGRAVRHTLGCLLARVAGRSPLEYLTGPERDQQRDLAVELMARPPGGVAELTQQFLERV